MRIIEWKHSVLCIVVCIDGCVRVVDLNEMVKLCELNFGNNVQETIDATILGDSLVVACSG